MGEYRGALDVAQKVQAEPLAFGRSWDKPRNVRHGERLMPHIHHTQVGLESGEGVITDFWLRRRKHRNQRGLTCRGEAH